jgi:hypothetical protein
MEGDGDGVCRPPASACAESSDPAGVTALSGGSGANHTWNTMSTRKDSTTAAAKRRSMVLLPAG